MIDGFQVAGAVLISLVVYLIVGETRWKSRLDGATGDSLQP